jgi:hypothetical protein
MAQVEGFIIIFDSRWSGHQYGMYAVFVTSSLRIWFIDPVSLSNSINIIHLCAVVIQVVD